MAWILLVAAGLFEVAWLTLMKQSSVSARPGLFLLSILVSFISFALLYLAMRDIPLGTSYAVWTGIGAVGATIAGIVLFGESGNPGRLFFLAMVVAGIIGLKWFDGTSS